MSEVSSAGNKIHESRNIEYVNIFKRVGETIFQFCLPLGILNIKAHLNTIYNMAYIVL